MHRDAVGQVREGGGHVQLQVEDGELEKGKIVESAAVWPGFLLLCGAVLVIFQQIALGWASSLHK